MFVVGNSIKDVTVGQSGCGVQGAAWVMIDSGASVNVSHMVLEHHTDERVRLGGADGKPHHGHGTPQLWLKIGTITKRDEFQMSGVTKSIVSVSSLYESGVEVRFNKQLFLNSDEDCAPLLKMVSAT